MDTKSQQSQFANFVLPTQFLNDPPSVVIPLIAPNKVTPGGRDLLVQLWEAAGEFATDNGVASPDELDYRMEILGHPNSTAGLIEMPTPSKKGEVHFAAIIFDGPGLAAGKPRQLRYFTLEHQGDDGGTSRTMLVEWRLNSDGELERTEHEPGTSVDMDAFVGKVQEIITTAK